MHNPEEGRLCEVGEREKEKDQETIQDARGTADGHDGNANSPYGDMVALGASR